MAKLKVTEMKNAKVGYISLVKRGANRIPFRVLKSDNEETTMLNLDNLSVALGRAVKSEAAEPKGAVVLGIATTAEGAELELVTAAIEESGFSVAKADKTEDGSTCFVQGDDIDLDADEVSVVRLSDTMAMVVKGFSPYRGTLDNSFVDKAKAQGFYSSVGNACDVLKEGIHSMLSTSDSPADATLGFTKLFSDFQSYVGGLVAELPSAAFYISDSMEVARASKAEAEAPAEDETLVEDVSKVADEETAVQDPAEPATEENTVSTEPTETVEKAADVEAVTTETGTTEVVETETVEKADPLAEVLAALQGLTVAVKGISEAQESMASEQKTLSDRVDEVTRKSEDALKAVGGMVVSSPTGDDQPTADKQVAKSDDDPRTGCFDTAFIKRNR